MMKNLYITTTTTAIFLMLTILVLISSACTPGKKTPKENIKPSESKQNAAPLMQVQGSISQAESAISAGSGEVTSPASGPGSTGTSGLTNSASGSTGWPADVLIMEGLKAATTSTSGIFIANASGTVKPKDVEKFYLALKGWTKKEPPKGQVNSPGVISFTMEKEGKTLNVTITESKGTTTVQLMYMPKR
jgi:hypothetical protein